MLKVIKVRWSREILPNFFASKTTEKTLRASVVEHTLMSLSEKETGIGELDSNVTTACTNKRAMQLMTFGPFHTSQHKYSPDPWFSCSWWSACSETQAWICSQPQSLDRKTPTNNSINRWQVVFTDWHKVHKIPTDKTTKRAGSVVSKFQVNAAFKRWRCPCSSHEGMKSPHRFAISTTEICNLNRWRVHHEMAATHTVEKLLQSDSQTVLNRNHGTAASSRGATKAAAPSLSSGFYK